MERKARARQLYFEYIPVSEICKLVEVNRTTVQRWVSGASGKNRDLHIERTWKYQRDKRKKHLVGEIEEQNDYHIQRIYRAGLPIIARSIECLENTILGIDDVKKLTDIITDIDKLIRLNNDRPTEITKTIGTMDLNALKKFVNKDPFMQSKDVTPVEKPKALIEGQIDLNKVKVMDIKPPEPEPTITNDELEMPGKWADDE